MRIYAVAILVFSDMQDMSGTTPAGSTFSNCLPALIPAESIEAAAEAARIQAFERWKPAEGWHTHQIHVLPVTMAFYEAAFKAYDEGGIDEEPEGEGRAFNYDSQGRLI